MLIAQNWTSPVTQLKEDGVNFDPPLKKRLSMEVHEVEKCMEKFSSLFLHLIHTKKN